MASSKVCYIPKAHGQRKNKPFMILPMILCTCPSFFQECLSPSSRHVEIILITHARTQFLGEAHGFLQVELAFSSSVFHNILFIPLFYTCWIALKLSVYSSVFPSRLGQLEGGTHLWLLAVSCSAQDIITSFLISLIAFLVLRADRF